LIVEERGLSAYIAELVGTFLLVLFIALIVSVYGASSAPEFAAIGLLHAFLLMMLVQTLGGTSGAHFNPAVTIGLAAVRKIAPTAALGYIAMQVIGAIAGAALCKAILSELPHAAAASLGNPSVSSVLAGKTLLGALCELVGTFALVWAIMGVAVNPRGTRDWAGFVIGATLGFAVITFAPLTGASLNPARALGPAIIAGHFAAGFGDFAVVYILGPIVGGLIAALGYKLLVLDPQERVGQRPIDKLA
jgi:MIP family channel proteins